MLTFDVLIVGSGLAGMTLALHLAEHKRVALVTKKDLLEASSCYAQGGIAAVLDTGDSVEAHIHDTLVAGAGLCNELSTRFIVEHSREAIDWLIALGVPFTRGDDQDQENQYRGFHLTREGGHSHRRIIHAADATGEAVIHTLGQKIRAHPNITVLEHHIAIDLITSDKLGQDDKRCLGAYVLETA
ncbi:MAG: FAD-dependent oxidoreductase, partial [Laribacter sp.]|nr:FAD-dependent oxidoreductase [Laribacter sp.]